MGKVSIQEFIESNGNKKRVETNVYVSDIKVTKSGNCEEKRIIPKSGDKEKRS